jgi:hypothetical protein
MPWRDDDKSFCWPGPPDGCLPWNAAAEPTVEIILFGGYNFAHSGATEARVSPYQVELPTVLVFGPPGAESDAGRRDPKPFSKGKSSGTHGVTSWFFALADCFVVLTGIPIRLDYRIVPGGA